MRIARSATSTAVTERTSRQIARLGRTTGVPAGWYAWRVRRALLLLVAGLAGCPGRGAYTCTDSAQCVLGGVQGSCEPEGLCAFPDPACPGGRRFATDSNDVAGTCVVVDAAVPDAAPACGDFGQACCATGATCAAGASCVSGTCRGCVEDIEIGRHFSCVRKVDNSVLCIGENIKGQIGNAFAGAPVTTWTAVRDSTTSTAITDATQISTGGNHACAIRTGGAVWCWGDNAQGQVGNNLATDATSAVRVIDANDQPLTGITMVRAHRYNTCALGAGGAVWCWGRNTDGQVGDGTTSAGVRRATPVLIAPAGAAFTGAVEISVNDQSACARKQDNSVWCWGRNTAGAVGDGTTMPRPNPALVTGGDTATMIDGGVLERSCMVRSDNTVACWGQAWRSRLGNGFTNYDPMQTFVSSPTTVITTRGGPALAGVSKIALGGATCALMLDTSVQCWGDNMHGSTGAGIGSPFPVPVVHADGTPLTGIDRLSAGFSHACAHRSVGGWLCWGRNQHGELSAGTADIHFPTPHGFTCP